MTDAIQAQTVTITGHGGDEIEAYLARPLSAAPRGGVVLIHHMPGYDSWSKEVAVKFAMNGYAALMPNLYWRDAPGASSDDAAAAGRANGGVPDARLVGDVDGAAKYLNTLEHANGRIGVIGHCSGGRQSFLAATSLQLDAAVDCYGAFVVNDPPEGSGFAMTSLLGQADKLSCPLLGLFGNDDKFPAPDEVAKLDAELTKLDKAHEFHGYDGAGHAFFAYDRPSYRPEAANDGYQKIFAFFGTHLSA
jgi:carboxymethylenebutenolidase